MSVDTLTVVHEIRKSGYPLLPFLRFGFIARNQLPLLVLYETTDRLPLIKFDRVVVLPLAALSMKPPPPPCCHPVYVEVVGYIKVRVRFPLAVETDLMLVGSNLRVGEKVQQVHVVVQELWPRPQLLLQPRLSLGWKLGDHLDTEGLEGVAYGSFGLEHL